MKANHAQFFFALTFKIVSFLKKKKKGKKRKKKKSNDVLFMTKAWEFFQESQLPWSFVYTLESKHLLPINQSDKNNKGSDLFPCLLG